VGRAGCESKTKGGGILGSRGASSGIRRSIRAAAEGSSASRRGARQRRRAANSTPTASWLPVPTTSPVGVRRVPGSVLLACHRRRQNDPRIALLREQGGDRPVVYRRRTLLRAVQSIGQEGSRFGTISSPALQLRDPSASRSNSLPIAAQEHASRAVGHSGPHESEWAKDSSMIPVDSRKMARLYLAFASFCSRLNLLDAASRASPRSGHRSLPCRSSAHPVVSTDAFDLLQRIRRAAVAAGVRVLRRSRGARVQRCVRGLARVDGRPRAERERTASDLPVGSSRARAERLRGMRAGHETGNRRLGWCRNPLPFLPTRRELLAVRRSRRTRATAPRRASSTASSGGSSRPSWRRLGGGTSPSPASSSRSSGTTSAVVCWRRASCACTATTAGSIASFRSRANDAAS